MPKIEGCSVCNSSAERSTDYVWESQSASNHGLQNCAKSGRWRWWIHQPEGSESMLGEEHHIVVLSSTSTILQWHSRANGWHAQDYSPPNVEAGESRERMVVLCVSICRPRESSRERMASSSIWSVGWNMEVPWQGTGEVTRWSRLCRISIF